MTDKRGHIFLSVRYIDIVALESMRFSTIDSSSFCMVEILHDIIY